ncbi:hypothetical protein CMO83_01720 [Candidatus Woesearchaeota archaeon]|jgi:hypothetical protein|nr:hypothetical protein [Candidatus Woesearchaeota archaeon]MDP6648112.1 hypothetical protein [Candidatus Woesearchaeota archaeon]|tara:strand:- start:65919 stop:66347 length:429 start_codon:yes stop_codon:yes gene_type:complete
MGEVNLDYFEPSNLNGSLTLEFLDTSLDLLLHPRDGPSGRDLEGWGYICIGQRRNRLDKTEIWVRPGTGGMGDIRALEYGLGGFFRSDSHRNHFGSEGEARSYFSQYGVTDELFNLVLSPQIIIRQPYTPVSEPVQMKLPFQ